MPLKCLHTEWNLFKQKSEFVTFREHVTNYNGLSKVISSTV